MSWFSSRRPPAGADPRPGVPASPKAGAAAGTPPPSPGQAAANLGGVAGAQAHPSLGLAALIGSFGGHEKLQVLDLGPAVGSNVEFLSRFGCKLYIQDLYPALAARHEHGSDPDAAAGVAPWDRAVAREARETWEARQAREEGDRAKATFEALMSFPEGTLFDAVFAWDLFNYLDRRDLADLARQLARFCRPGALVLALISIQKQIPAEPMRLRIVDDSHLTYEPRTPALRPCPRYAPAELSEVMRGFQLDRSFLMRHGIQEYLFVRTPG